MTEQSDENDSTAGIQLTVMAITLAALAASWFIPIGVR
jgi:hypothetical protein